MDAVVGIFMVVMAVGIAVIWGLDIRAGRGYETDGPIWKAVGHQTGSRMIFHWAAEYATAVALVAGGFGLLLDAPVAVPLAAAALGALAYTATNSLAWVTARPERHAYGIPMAVGLVGAITSLGVLLLG